jgi:hypothetical protein
MSQTGDSLGLESLTAQLDRDCFWPTWYADAADVSHGSTLGRFAPAIRHLTSQP